MGRSIPAAPDVSAEVADLVGAVARQIRMSANRELEPLGITWGQMRALRTVAHCDGRIRMSDLADRLNIARRSATSVVDELVERGLVDRHPGEHDRRAVEVGLTSAGRQLLDKVRRRRRATAHELTASLAPDELDTLRDLLWRLHAEAHVDAR